MVSGKHMKAGDMWIYEPNEISDVEFIADSELDYSKMAFDSLRQISGTKLIAHRGNINGPNPETENTVNQIDKVLKRVMM